MIPQAVALSSHLRDLTGRPWFWAALVGVLFAGPLLRGLTQGAPPAAPAVLGEFPAFDLLADDGRRFASGDLRGRPFIADLLSPDRARAEAETMRAVQHRTRNQGDALWLLSFSDKLDAVGLRELQRGPAAGQRWTLLAGAPGGAGPLFAGENILLLVDGRRRIRGRYEAKKPGEIDRLMRDAALVAGFR